ncbi:ankyrin repeat and SOCS box protein 13 isoform X1 [Kryptolebias marmoratus]|uniref:ankyrin repeat and SOCS box protein 13 isoform X1 n=1 Tax=Kryptolebias marmoratus TaxID=37003 RepID=UPI000D530BCA|nr:ankyrin repeat and SOCS box protein 13 isoform X1 [Kryptolebias marmoratus]
MEKDNSPSCYFGDIGCWAERTEVHKAASLGRASDLQRLIQSGASVNVVAVDSITPLHEACLGGQARCVRLLLDAGAQVDARNVDGSTPLCDACSAGSLECVKLLLEHGAKANPALTSRTASPLHEACMGGNSDCVELLIATGACLEAYDLYYGTPLHVACVNKHTDCVKVLLNAGAKVNAARLHETPLHHAAKNMRAEMIEVLVEFGANIYARDQHNKKPVDYTTPGSPSAACLLFYETQTCEGPRQQLCVQSLPSQLLKLGPPSESSQGSWWSFSLLSFFMFTQLVDLNLPNSIHVLKMDLTALLGVFRAWKSFFIHCI